jgi:4-amino-4-deoxy-L-arabinose transferase-like glycosyltransferase
MVLKKKDINKTLIFILSSHFVIWVLIPSLSNNNLPLDVIEAIVWSDGWPLGWEKHPPLSSWFPGLFFITFGNQDWFYYLLSQVFVVFSLIIVWKFSLDFFDNKIHSLISVLLLEGIFFYNFTTPEFNVNVCQLPFWALTVFYCWQGIKYNNYTSWILLGFFAALGVLSKYLFIYLLIAITTYFIYMIIKKNFSYKCLISLIPFFLVLTPHLIWLSENNYITFSYAISRTDTDEINYLKHIFNPLIFLGKQIGILIPFFFMGLLLIKQFNKKINLRDKKLNFLTIVTIVPILLMLLTSIVLGIKIRTMWMTPFYLFIGVLVVYIFQSNIELKKFKNFLITFVFIFLLYPATYLYISTTQKDKRTDYPGKEIAKIVQDNWDKNFTNEIRIVGGDMWHGGNLSYNLKSKPKWDNILNTKSKTEFNSNEDGFVLIGDPNILEKICDSFFLKVKKQGVCMLGIKK